MEYDVLFLHPPSSFKKLTDPLCGIFPDDIGTNDLFLHTPVGLMALYHKLKSRGFNPGFLNVGRLLHRAIEQEESFDLVQLVKNLPAVSFGIDLHWAVHTPGALELAETIKKIIPHSFVFLGGLTSTYFYRELLEDYPFIDAVVLGEADEAIVPLVEALKRNNLGSRRGQIPNLAYRSGEDRSISVNRVQIPSKWENISFQDVEEDLDVAFICIKGCSLNCPTCGGSRFSYKNFFFREKPLALAPGRLAQEIEKCGEKGIKMVYILGDIRIMGERYVDSFLTELSKRKLDTIIQQEIIIPPEPSYLERWKKAAPSCTFSFRAESADSAVLQRMGKGFSNREVIALIENCKSLELPLALSFMFAMPGQDVDSIRYNMDFIEEGSGSPYIKYIFGPIFFIDPGSPIFEDPEKWGYHIEYRTIKDLKKNLEKPHWSQCIGYHTQWLSKDEFVDMILYVTERTNRIRLTQNPVHAPHYLLNIENMELNRELVDRLRAKELPSGTDIDSYLRNIIKQTFPPYLLKDNLLRKYHITKSREIPYYPFPYLSYLLMHTFHVSPRVLLKWFKKQFEAAHIFPDEISLEEFKKNRGAPPGLKKEISNLTHSLNINIHQVFIDNLVDFEWINELAARVNNGSIMNTGEQEENFADHLDMENFSKFTLSPDETVVLKSFDFNFEQIDWETAPGSVVPGRTCYLYFLRKGTRRGVTPVMEKLLTLCSGNLNALDIIKNLKETGHMEEFAILMNIGALVSEGILLPQI